MNKDQYAVCGFVLVAGAAIAVWAGTPWTFLLFLACPVMMFFMMKGMGGMQSTAPAEPSAQPVTPPTDGVEHR